MIFAVSCARQETVDVINPGDMQNLKLSPEIPGVAMARLTDDFAESIEKNGGAVPPELADAGIDTLERLFPYAGEFEARTRAEGLHKWYKLHYDEEISYLKSGLADAKLPGVELIEPAFGAKPTSFPFNDPYLSKQWHYRNDGTGSSRWMAGADINVYPVWENITTGSPEVVVAVVDGGIDPNHEDLVAHLDLSRSYNYCSGYYGPQIYAHDHGTHVAGTIAAVNNNGKGVCGVAGGDAAEGRKGVTLISLQIFQTVKGSREDIGGDGITAIKEAADKGAVICQNSWGYDLGSESSARSAKVPSYMKSAIDYFNKYAGLDKNGKQVGPMAGGVVFFAAGNENWEYSIPASYDGCIAVGSFDCTGTSASYTNFGDWVDIAAPGGDEIAGKWDGTDFYTSMIASTVPDNGYASYPYVGTSMACPHVSGVAALLVSYFGGPGFTRDMLIHKLLDGADPNTLNTTRPIGPKLDAWGSFTVDGGEYVPAIPEVKGVDIDDDSVILSLSVTADDKGTAANQLGVLISKDRDKVAASSPLSLMDGVRKEMINLDEPKEGDVVDLVIPELDYKTTYYYSVFAKSPLNVYSSCSEVQTVYVKENLPPYMETVLEDVCTGKPGSFTRVRLDDYFKDPENKTLRYTASSDDPDLIEVDVDGNELVLYPHKYGSTVITVSASDKHTVLNHSFLAATRDSSVPIDVYPNPVVDSLHIRTGQKCNASVRIISNTGKEYISKELTLKATGSAIYVGNLKSGVYTAAIEINGGRKFNKNIVKL